MEPFVSLDRTSGSCNRKHVDSVRDLSVLMHLFSDQRPRRDCAGQSSIVGLGETGSIDPSADGIVKINKSLNVSDAEHRRRAALLVRSVGSVSAASGP